MLNYLQRFPRTPLTDDFSFFFFLPLTIQNKQEKKKNNKWGQLKLQTNGGADYAVTENGIKR
jgi:hypothetical protein